MCEKIISDNTFYYFFSSCPQVLSAMAALMGLYVQFTIKEIKDYLVGDGEAVYKRKDDADISGGNRDTGYDRITKTNKQRLLDAIVRRDIEAIGNELKGFAENEKNDEIAREKLMEHPIIKQEGFQKLYERFSDMTIQRNKLSTKNKYTISFSIFTIISMLVSLGLFDQIKKCENLEIILFGINGIFTVISLVCFWMVIRLGLKLNK